ncbi:MAG: hypothetical protein C5B54_12260 [Acidobacteria bacterium]|nr:MAG: hypothetical protein C5B54_12260 [Acidobacteriota bacterium]
MPSKRIFVPLLLFLLCAGLAWSQVTTGSMKGVITDSEGKPVPGATVTITSAALIGGTRTAYTNDLGAFRFPSLPIGSYAVEATLEGFTKVQVQKVDVRLDATANVPMTMSMATKTEEVNVMGEAPLIDVTQSGLSTNYSKEILENTPTQRSFYNMIQIAPGVSQSYGDGGSDRTIAFGSNMQSNSWNVDGLETTAPETGSTWLYQAPDSIDEIQVIGVGAPAEYGNHLGAVFNVVTKKGGNQLHGAGNMYWTNNSLMGSNVKLPACDAPGLANGAACFDNTVPTIDSGFHRNQFHDINLTSGGPIKKDRLWFFGSFESQRDDITQPGEDPTNSFPYKEDAYDGKVTGLIGKKNEFTGFYHLENYDNGGTDPYTVPTALYDERGRNHAWGGGLTSTISNNLLFEAHYAGWKTHDLQNSVARTNALDPFIEETPNGVYTPNYLYTGGVTYPFDYITNRHQVNGKVTYYAENFLKSQHEFRFGVQFSRGNADTLTAAGTNGFYTYDYYQDYYGYLFRVYQEPYRYGAITHDLGTFLDDTVTVNSRLTLNLGVRFDHNSGDIPSYPFLGVGEPSITEVGHFVELPGHFPGYHAMTWNKVSPRLGFVLQTRQGGKSVLQGSFGVYYDHNVSGNWDYASPSVTLFQRYQYFPDTNTRGDLLFEQNYSYPVDPKIQPPKTLQYALGYDHQIRDDVAFGVQYVYKDTTDLIGWEILGGEWAPVSFNDPFTGKPYTLLNRISPANLSKGNNAGDFCSHIVGGGTASMCNQDLGYFNKYHGVILTFTKKFSNRWALNASYTWSHSYGLNPRPLEQSQFNPFYGNLRGSDPNNWLNAYGNLQGDRPNMIRAQGVFHNLPWGLTAAANIDFSNGRPYTRQASVSSGGGLTQGRQRFIMSHQYAQPWFKTIDATFGKTFDISKTVHAFGNVGVYNILNSDSVLDLNSLVLNDPTAIFTPADWTKPRRVQFQFGVQY